MTRHTLCLLALALTLIGCGDKDTSSSDSGVSAGPVDADADGAFEADDCDDSDDSVYPGADESCDDVDNDCDDAVDEAPADGGTYYADVDGDGYGDPGATEVACSAPSGYATVDGDCDDADGAIHPSAQESCDEVDNDCDGYVDNDDPEGVSDGDPGYPDGDGDGYGDGSRPGTWCGGTLDDSDCDDTDATINPTALESCGDAADNDCDGAVDESTPSYPDFDGDGYGDDAAASTDCEPPSGYIAVGGDCDDADASVNPDGVEVCDGADNDCDGEADVLLREDFDDAVDPTVWSINGSASQQWDVKKDGYLQLTANSGSQAGTAFLIELQDADAWAVSFDLMITSPSGADGMTMAFLDETDPTLVGVNGGGLGVDGLYGYAFEWDTYHNGDVDPTSSDHVGLIETYDRTSLDYEVATSFAGVGEVAVDITFDAGDYALEMDGVRYLEATLEDYALKEVMLGFTAGTGGVSNEHAVDDFVLSCP